MNDYIQVLEETILKYNGKHVLDSVKKEGAGFLKTYSEKKEAAYMFLDIRGFTNISKKLVADTLLDDLNIYFEAMSDTILKNHGYIDSFIGDALFAFFGVSHDKYADDACRTALECMERLKIVNQKIQNRDIFEVGIGIATGTSMIGNIGSGSKLKFTAMGDAVNLASRLEGLTSKYNAPILICGNTQKKLTGTYSLRTVDTVTVKGLIGQIDIYELRSP